MNATQTKIEIELQNGVTLAYGSALDARVSSVYADDLHFTVFCRSRKAAEEMAREAAAWGAPAGAIAFAAA